MKTEKEIEILIKLLNKHFKLSKERKVIRKIFIKEIDDIVYKILGKVGRYNNPTNLRYIFGKIEVVNKSLLELQLNQLPFIKNIEFGERGNLYVYFNF